MYILVIFRSTKSLGNQKSILLPPDIINVTRMNDANQESVSDVSWYDLLYIRKCSNYKNFKTIQCVIQTTRFHPNAPVMLTGGLDKTLRFFQIDGKTNPKIQSIHFQDMPIRSAEFSADGREVIASGRRKFFYSIDVEQGQVEKISQIQGKHTMAAN